MHDIKNITRWCFSFFTMMTKLCNTKETANRYIKLVKVFVMSVTFQIMLLVFIFCYRPKATFQEALIQWRNATVHESAPPFLLLIHRNILMESTRRAAIRKGFSFSLPIKVSFTGEDGADYGGSRREFFRYRHSSLKATALSVRYL